MWLSIDRKCIWVRCHLDQEVSLYCLSIFLLSIDYEQAPRSHRQVLTEKASDDLLLYQKIMYGGSKMSC
jgi:hypothetical protein